jgi:hypothetical protein
LATAYTEKTDNTIIKKTNNGWQPNTQKKTDNTIIKKDKQWLAT